MQKEDRKPGQMLTKMIAASVTTGILLSACVSRNSTKPVSGARSAVIAIDTIMTGSQTIRGSRSAALLGVFLSEYLAIAPAAMAADGALLGIGAQQQIVSVQSDVRDPDFDLLQAFADAIQVDVADLLNRSVNRQETLETFTKAMTNVASRANFRYKELSSLSEELTDQARQLNREKSDAERQMKNALRDKDFSNAGELQKTVNEKQSAYAEVDLRRKQVDDVLETLETLLTLYGVKIVAIEQNREILISGTRVVDVPGIDDLQIIERTQRSRGTSGRGGAAFDSLFMGL